MKQLLTMIITMALSLSAWAGSQPKEFSTTPAFEKLKTLIGTWEGTLEMEEGKKQEAKLTYELTSGGTVIMERLFPATPHEMITMYTANGKVTHYCSIGNQPEMRLVEETDNSLTFKMKGKQGIQSKKEHHINGLKVVFKDKDHIIQEWTSFDKGKAQPMMPFAWKRAK